MEFLENLWANLSAVAVSAAVKLAAAIIVDIIGRQIIKLINKAFAKSRAANDMGESVRGFIASCINIVLNLILILTVASILGVPMTSIIALLGSAGLAIGLALQGGLSNFAGGVIILIFKPFEVDDYIVCSGEEGTVTKISVFYTTLTTPDNRRIVIPNSTVSNSSVTNVSVEPERRIDIDVDIPADSDTDKALKVLLEAAGNDNRVIDREPPFTALVGYGTGSVTVRLRIWCKTEDYWGVKFDMTKAVYESLGKAGIELARNAVDVRTK